MNEKLQGIVLHTVKHNERSNIVHIYTRSRGLLPFAVAQGATAGARARNAMLMPLSLVAFETRVAAGRDLYRLHDLRLRQPLTDLRANPVKNAIAVFVCELLTRVIVQRERDESLYDYLEASIALLESLREGTANFHLCFLYHLGAHLGIQPNMESYREGTWFDMDEGVFKPWRQAGGNYLPPEQARVLALLSRMTFANMRHFRFNREQRNQVLDTILTYYRLHHSTLGSLRSPDVLKQLFV